MANNRHWSMKEDREISLARDIARNSKFYESDEVDEVGRQAHYVEEKLKAVSKNVRDYLKKSQRLFSKFDIRDVQVEIGKLQASLSEFASEAQHRNTIIRLAGTHHKEVQKEIDDYNAEHQRWKYEQEQA
jgi:hypothetical protein